jgi:hypothetical protein
MKTYNHWNISDWSNKVLNAQENIKEMNSLKFTDKDLRGLSKEEKDFIIENNYNVAVTQYDLSGNSIKMYLHIKRNNLGKKELFAYTKKQALRPNQKDVSKSHLNHEILLKFNAKESFYRKFNTLEFERGFANNQRLIHLF